VTAERVSSEAQMDPDVLRVAADCVLQRLRELPFEGTDFHVIAALTHRGFRNPRAIMPAIAQLLAEEVEVIYSVPESGSGFATWRLKRRWTQAGLPF
jgi:uncharacterized membrane protein (DUF2068 family)